VEQSTSPSTLLTTYFPGVPPVTVLLRTAVPSDRLLLEHRINLRLHYIDLRNEINLKMPVEQSRHQSLSVNL